MSWLHWPSDAEWGVLLAILFAWGLERQIRDIAAMQREIKQKIEWLISRQAEKDRTGQ